MHKKVEIHQERDAVSFAIYVYPFEATNIAPGRGGDNLEEFYTGIDGVDIGRRQYPPDWEMGLEESLWWITLEKSWLEKREIDMLSNTTPYEIEYFMTALNLCLDPKLFFTRFARIEYQTLIDDGNLRTPSGFPQILEILERPVPRVSGLEDDRFSTLLDEIFRRVLLREKQTDLGKALESYRAAIQSFHSEIHVRLLYSACENVLFTGNPSGSKKDSEIAKISPMSVDEAESWRHLVNRTKHPDQGTSHEWEETFDDVPPPVELRMRTAANEAIKLELLK